MRMWASREPAPFAQAIVGILRHLRAATADEIVGELCSRFEYDRSIAPAVRDWLGRARSTVEEGADGLWRLAPRRE